MDDPLLSSTEAGLAFFDVDNTLISINSMMSFQDYWYQVNDDPAREAIYREGLAKHRQPNACRVTLNRMYYQHFAGLYEADVLEAGQSWFNHTKNALPNFYNASVLDELRAHQATGRKTVLVSGSFAAILNPIARDLGIDRILACSQEVKEGQYTGELLTGPIIDAGKSDAISACLDNSQIAQASYAYGDDISDIPMLELVGNPVIVAGGRIPPAQLTQLGWRVIPAA